MNQFDDEPDGLIILNTMLYVGGDKDAFRCSCGSNVFSKRRDERGEYYECHGCYTIYRETNDEPKESNR